MLSWPGLSKNTGDFAMFTFSATSAATSATGAISGPFLASAATFPTSAATFPTSAAAFPASAAWTLVGLTSVPCGTGGNTVRDSSVNSSAATSDIVDIVEIVEIVDVINARMDNI